MTDADDEAGPPASNAKQAKAASSPRSSVAQVPDVPWAEVPGRGIVTADLWGTAALAAVTLVTAVLDDDATAYAALAVAGALFLGGCVAFGLGFVRAAGRSRYEVVDLAGLFYLTGSAPRSVRRRLLGLWYLQILLAVGAVAVSIGVGDLPPFAVMAPVWGIGLLTLWGARHGTFPTRPPSRGR